jgi:hypothetical protein
MAPNWEAPIYAFFKPLPIIEYVEVINKPTRRCHTFICRLTTCSNPGIRRYLDTKDCQSTGNMRRHAKECWGKDVVNKADSLGCADAARELMDNKTQSSITSAFLRVKDSKKTYSTRQHTTVQVRLVLASWSRLKLTHSDVSSCVGWPKISDLMRS